MGISKEIRELEKKKGMVRGEKFRTHAAFITLKSEEEGLKKVEKELEKAGHPLVLSRAGTFKWYPAFIHPMILVILKEKLGWTDEDIFEMGTSSSKLSFINKFLVRYMISAEKVFQKAPQIWRSYYNVGELSLAGFNEKDKNLTIRLLDFDMHPLVCLYNKGYMLQTVRNGIRASNIKIEEKKCTHNGDQFHEYFVTWES